MPLDPSIKSVLVIGSGPIVIGKHVNLIIPERRLVVCFELKAFESFWLTQIRQQS